jgi:asparagine synthase (glutamine-hydrolysing)
MGFGVPVDAWMRGPLREWTESLLDPKRLHAEGYLDAKAVTSRWRTHLQGHHNWRDSLWLVLMWQTWLEQNR